MKVLDLKANTVFNIITLLALAIALVYATNQSALNNSLTIDCVSGNIVFMDSTDTVEIHSLHWGSWNLSNYEPKPFVLRKVFYAHYIGNLQGFLTWNLTGNYPTRNTTIQLEYFSTVWQNFSYPIPFGVNNSIVKLRCSLIFYSNDVPSGSYSWQLCFWLGVKNERY